MDRTPEEAFKGALRGAENQEAELGSGRTVPIEVFLDTHQGARESIGKIVDSFKDDPRVNVEIWDNTGGIGEQFKTTVDKISKMDYEKSLTEVNGILEKAYENNEISASVYAGFKGSPPPYRNNYQPQKQNRLAEVRELIAKSAKQVGKVVLTR
ncbi:MAG: hypothetical protein P8J44_06140 [Gammaproteobacteria bacterium]|nr:hypothetical protein [Gammaproteobacteria bacterium]